MCIFLSFNDFRSSDLLSMCKGETALGNGSRLPLVISTSIKAKDEQEEREAVKDHQRQESERSGPATLGDLIKAQMDQPSEDK